MDISNIFPPFELTAWQEAAAKSLKLNNYSEVEAKLNEISLNDLTYKSYYADSVPHQLDSFPKRRKLARCCEKISPADEEEGIDLFFSFSKLKHKNAIRFITTAEQTPEDGDYLDLIGIYQSLHYKYSDLKEALKDSQHPILVNTSKIHNAGASTTQELAFVLDCLKFISEETQNKNKVIVNLALDSHYFASIAKLRAVRFMAEKLKAQGLLNEFEICSSTSFREQTLYDPWVNMLRTTSAMTAAFHGGADIITTSSYDRVGSYYSNYEESNFAKRQSRNIFHVLKDESSLEKVLDPSYGSVAVENLTAEIIAKSYVLFKEDTQGGILRDIEGFADRVQAIAQKREEILHKTKFVQTGINNYAQIEETLNEYYKIDNLQNAQNGDFFPLRRFSQKLEELRFSLEEKELSIKLYTYGPLNKLSARAGFCSNYFELLGKKVESIHIENPEEMLGSKADIHILCSLDEMYSDIIESFQTLKGKLFIGGNKDKFDNVQNIFMGQDKYQILSQLGGQ